MDKPSSLYSHAAKTQAAAPTPFPPICGDRDELFDMADEIGEDEMPDGEISSSRSGETKADRASRIESNSGVDRAERMAVTGQGKAAQEQALGALCDWLQENGFRVGTNPMADQMNECKWYAYRKVSGDARDCDCNDKPPSLCVYPHLFKLRDRQYSSVEVKIGGQVGSPWFRVEAYSIGLDELPDLLPEVEFALLRAWNALALANHAPNAGEAFVQATKSEAE